MLSPWCSFLKLSALSKRLKCKFINLVFEVKRELFKVSSSRICDYWNEWVPVFSDWQVCKLLINSAWSITAVTTRTVFFLNHKARKNKLYSLTLESVWCTHGCERAENVLINLLRLLVLLAAGMRLYAGAVYTNACSNGSWTQDMLSECRGVMLW